MSSKVDETISGPFRGQRGSRRTAPRRVGVSKVGPRLALLVLLAASLLISVTGLMVSGGVQPQIQGRIHPLRYESEIGAVAARYGLDPYLVAAVARAESGYDPRAVSPAGAVGLMQIMPATAEWIGRRDDWLGGPVDDLTDPVVSLELGSFYLAFLIDLFEGDLRSALAAYNAGQGTVAAWIDEAGGERPSLDAADIPFAETREFVERVERFQTIYREIHPEAFST